MFPPSGGGRGRRRRRNPLMQPGGQGTGGPTMPPVVGSGMQPGAFGQGGGGPAMPPIIGPGRQHRLGGALLAMMQLGGPGGMSPFTPPRGLGGRHPFGPAINPRQQPSFMNPQLSPLLNQNQNTLRQQPRAGNGMFKYRQEDSRSRATANLDPNRGQDLFTRRKDNSRSSMDIDPSRLGGSRSSRDNDPESPSFSGDDGKKKRPKVWVNKNGLVRKKGH